MATNKFIKQVKDIIKGHVNELFDNNEKLYEHRISICKECPLYLETGVGPICNDSLWISPKTYDVSKTSKRGYVKGCKCRLTAKTRNEDNHCIVNKW